MAAFPPLPAAAAAAEPPPPPPVLAAECPVRRETRRVYIMYHATDAANAASIIRYAIIEQSFGCTQGI